MKAKNLVVVESPAKARTLSKILDRSYVIKASFGHVMDLPKNRLGFDPENNFKPEYLVTKDKYAVVKELKSYIDDNTVIWLAADDDREGEMIAHTLLTALNIKNQTVKRIIFHEITKDAILKALENPTVLNENVSDAAMARRILDRAVGYKLSPLLWKKVKYGLSAGRVQSVAVMIVNDKEKEIDAFIPEEFWKLKLDVFTNPAFKAELAKFNGKSIKITNGNDANRIKGECDNYPYTLISTDEKTSTRYPSAPFTTSTLQQEASNRIDMSPKVTMMVAQKLYEGSISVSNHTGGLITYMRTDSLNLSTVALQAANKVIANEYGKEYTIDTPRTYHAKGKAKVAAQEAHEAIRPVNMELKPSMLKYELDNQQLRLYTLIWQRTLATQMKEAKVALTTFKISAGVKGEYEFTAKGTKIIFPGFMKAFTEGSENPDDALSGKDKLLPNVSNGYVFDKTKLVTEQNFTKPPARYTEASLIKKLESEGIGRPSTYAPTLATIIQREYVIINEDKRLEPTLIGGTVSDYLKTNFPVIMNTAFTANIESEFDKIAHGEIKWQKVMQDFYSDFSKSVDEKQGGERVQFSEAKLLGVDKDTKLNVYIKTGQYGAYIQVGEADKEKNIKPHKISPVPKEVKLDSVTLENAYHYLKVPGILGKYNGDDIKVSIGRFGPFLQVNKNYYSIKKNDEYDVYSITLPIATQLIKEIDEEKAKSLLCDFPKDNIKVIIGRFGPYIKSGKNNFKLPKGMKESDIRKLTLAKVKEIIKSQPVSKKSKWKKK